MALTDPQTTGLTFHSARLAKPFHDKPLPAQALARLAALRDEAHHTLLLSQLLDRSPQASLALMGLGSLILLAASLQGGALLDGAFVWSLWILTGIAAMTVVYIRGFARHPAHQPLETAAGELHKFLLYTGLAWGLGAFLILPEHSGLGLILSFGVLPGWTMRLILRNEKASLAFSTPVALVTASACALRPWGHAPLAAAVIILSWLSAAFMLHRANHSRVPAPL